MKILFSTIALVVSLNTHSAIGSGFWDSFEFKFTLQKQYEGGNSHIVSFNDIGNSSNAFSDISLFAYYQKQNNTNFKLPLFGTKNPGIANVIFADGEGSVSIGGVLLVAGIAAAVVSGGGGGGGTSAAETGGGSGGTTPPPSTGGSGGTTPPPPTGGSGGGGVDVNPND